jgi:signal transduction histidine kinase
MQTLIDSIAEGVVALTEDARVLRMNPAAVSLLDIAPPPPFAPIGTLIRHPDLRDHLEESVILSLPAREFRMGDRHLLVSSRLLGAGGSVVTLSDVTELRRIEQVRRDFVANASHELKTPLTAVRGFAETLLEDEKRDGVGRDFLQSIWNNTVRLQHLVDDLLDLSRLESGGWTPSEEEIDLAEAATAAWDELASENRHRSIEFAVEGNAIVLADGQALHQIFRNLFDNAVRYTPDGGRVRVSISSEGPLAETAVSDTGSGIPSSSLARIFERFYRVDVGRDRVAGGTGLGLAIVRHLVQSMGGRVVAESQLGHGTTIRFSLPLVEAATPTS